MAGELQQQVNNLEHIADLDQLASMPGWSAIARQGNLISRLVDSGADNPFETGVTLSPNAMAAQIRQRNQQRQSAGAPQPTNPFQMPSQYRDMFDGFMPDASDLRQLMQASYTPMGNNLYAFNPAGGQQYLTNQIFQYWPGYMQLDPLGSQE